MVKEGKRFSLRLDPKKIHQAIFLIVLGITLRIALAGYANIEPVLGIALMAGLILGGVYAFIVPFSIMALSDMAINALHYEGAFGWKILFGISFFTWTGMMFVGYMGTRAKPKLLFTMKGVGVFTGIAVILTILYDMWTVVGIIILIPYASPSHIIVAQIPFSIYHILSTLIFVPLFGVGYYYICEFGLPNINDLKTPVEIPEDEA